MRQLLAAHGAHCTFIVCSEYLAGLEDAAGALLRDGHELGNHMAADRSFHYHALPAADFAAELAEV